jgi:hypothetical protein
MVRVEGDARLQGRYVSGMADAGCQVGSQSRSEPHYLYDHYFASLVAVNAPLGSNGSWKMKTTAREFVVGIVAVLLIGSVKARDLDNRYNDSGLKHWFDQLASGKGRCCSIADGQIVADSDWDSRDGHYRVRLNGSWVDVPDDAVIAEPNRAGATMVWPLNSFDGLGIRCFMPATTS